jgi:hypothetical protein
MQTLLASADGSSTCEWRESDWSFVLLKGRRIHTHKTIRVRYTTYDLRREEDLIRSHGSKSNIMVLNPEYSGPSGLQDIHPFRYGRVLGIYHANTIYVGAGNRDFSSRRLNFVWVRWYQVDRQGEGYTIVSFPDLSDPAAFSFLNPSDILRGCFIIPYFSKGLKGDKKGKSARAQDREDHAAYVVNQ